MQAAAAHRSWLPAAFVSCTQKTPSQENSGNNRRGSNRGQGNRRAAAQPKRKVAPGGGGTPGNGTSPPALSIESPVLPSVPPDNRPDGLHLVDPAGLQLDAQQPAASTAAARWQAVQAPVVLIARPLPRVLLLHCGGTMGMDAQESYEQDVDGHMVLKPGTGGKYHKPGMSEALKPGKMLGNLLNLVPQLKSFASLDLKVAFNLDSSNVGPKQWVQLARILDANRDHYDAFLIAHGTDTLSYTASALSLLLAGFRKPIVMTGSQLPLALPRSDAAHNLLDALTCATAAFSPPHVHLQEVAVCFGGRLMRGNRSQKVNSSAYQAFDSLNYPHLATMGVDVSWNVPALLKVDTVYRPRFNLDPRVIRVPIVPGSDPRTMYGDLAARGVKGLVLEAFGVGNMPDRADAGWLPWLREQRRKGMLVYLGSQCAVGPLRPELYKSGSAALKLGVESGPQMTPDCAVVKLMLCLAYRDLPLGMPLAGEL